jgi:hypothetical protein
MRPVSTRVLARWPAYEILIAEFEGAPMQSIDAKQLGNIPLIAGGMLYLVVFAASSARLGVHGADQSLSLLISLPLMLIAASIILVRMAFYVGILAGVPWLSLSYGLATMKRNWQAIVGGILLVTGLVAIIAAAIT